MNLLINALAISRLTTLIAQDEITQPVRDAVSRLADQHENVWTTKLEYLVSCTKCVSVWAAFGILLANRWRWARPLVSSLAGSQAAMMVMTAQDLMERQ